MSDLQALLDRQAIHDCLLRFCRGMDRFDRELYLSAFHDDAEMAAGPYVGDVPGCWDWAMPMHRDGQVLTHHLLLNHYADIDGDTAHSECYYQFVARNHPFAAGEGETVMLAGGRYIDRLERRDGAWKIALRTNIIEWSCLQPSLPPPFADVPDIAANGVSARDRSDPSYQRPLVNRRTQPAVSARDGLLRAEPFQIAYATNDIERACGIFSERYGIREFRRLEGQRPAGGHIHVELAWVGPLMYEIFTGHGPGMEIFMDRVPQDRFVIQHHHIGHWVRDEDEWAGLEAAAQRAERPLIGVSKSEGFTKSGFVDAPELGHYLEYVLPEPAAIAFFNDVPRH